MAFFFDPKSGQELKLLGVRITNNITNDVADVQIVQTFENTTGQVLDGVYTFPLDPASAIYSLEFDLPNEHIVAQVKEKEVAKKEFDEAIRAGHTAAMASQERQEFLNIQVGNIDVNTQVLVRLSMIVPLLSEGQSFRFVLPTTISPRYNPSSGGFGNIFGSPWNRQSQEEVGLKPSQISVDTHIESNATLGSVKCLSGDVVVSTLQKGHVYNVSPGHGYTNWTKDYVLVLELDDSLLTQAAVEAFGSYYGVSVSICPSFIEPDEFEDSTKLDFVFLLDRSGSMDGSPIRKVKDTMMLFIKSLPMDCSFNIVGFGSSHQKLFPTSVKYDQSTLRTAEENCSHLRADLGGTEILRPVQEILSERREDGKRLVLFILTDGEVGNTEEVLTYTERNRGSARIFTFGIGTGVSHQLVRGLADIGKGTAEFIVGDEKLDDKVIRALDQSLKPAFSDVSIDWAQLPYDKRFEDQSSKAVIFDGARTCFHEILTRDAQNPIKGSHVISFNGSVGTKPYSFEVELNFDTTSDTNGSVFRLAALKKIRKLEKKNTPITDQHMIALSIDASILSTKTTFIGVSKSKVKGERIAAQPVYRPMPIVDYRPTPFGGHRSPGSRRRGASPTYKTMCLSASAPKSRRLSPTCGVNRCVRASPASFGFASQQATPSPFHLFRTVSSLFGFGAAAPMTHQSNSYDDASQPEAMDRFSFGELASQANPFSLRSSSPRSSSRGQVRSSSRGQVPVSAPFAAKKMTKEEILKDIVRLQNAMGYWESSSEVTELIKVESSFIQYLASKYNVSHEVAITQAIIQILELHFAESSASLTLLARKARAFVSKNMQSSVAKAISNEIAPKVQSLHFP